MSKNIISILLSTLFLVFLTAPTVITMIDDTIDVSIFYVSGEEEEKGCEKTEKNKEIFCFEFGYLETDFITLESDGEMKYFFKKYAKPHLNLISPPPEFHI